MKHIHFLGIGGSGTSAAANIAKSLGYRVTGCDKSLDSEFIKEPPEIPISEGHSVSHLQDVDILAVTPAILSLDPKNPELVEAKKKRIKVLTWQEFTGKYLLKDKFVIAICGTHGKTTTTAMVGQILEDAGLDPTVLVGAIFPKWGKNFRIGNSKYFVIEADEFNDNYLSITPDISVVTTIEFDHPEYFKDFEKYKRSFQNFLHFTKLQIIANLTDKGAAEVLTDPNTLYGRYFKPIIDYSKTLIDFPLKVLGQHNILNATAAFQSALVLGIKPETIQRSLQNFSGVGRRMELVGEYNGAQVYTDFGHHPTEIKVTMNAFKEKFPEKKLWLIFQPHMFSRTKALFDDFVKVFKDLPVDGIMITDIYPSREVDTGIVNSKELVDAVGKSNIEYVKDISSIKEEMKKTLSEKDVVVFMGAGNIDRVAREITKMSS